MIDKTNHQTIIKLLIQIAASDQEITASETDFILRVTQSFGMTEADMDRIQLDRSAIAWPKSEQDRMNILYYVLFMLRADHQILPEEIVAIKRIGFKLGFRSRLVEDMLDKLSANPDNIEFGDDLLNTIKKYLN